MTPRDYRCASTSLAQRNPIVISVRQAFAANRFDSRAFCLGFSPGSPTNHFQIPHGPGLSDHDKVRFLIVFIIRICNPFRNVAVMS